ncbi:TIGR02757 family protein [Pontibacter sp. BT310]|uniref:TIGR02757 family protein n=1 Tax=Pontibacter populi TaxID=890055 RepID=A0ABS6XF15_9BACT|nr:MULTISPECIES: TIGR02757 family protein [Pontibacter]MBJ6118941.1 TIGR02757 family protein [Pontibacter sp. BT310]MBW3365795.1 TIGR02757 family protein [Pontibacter populi]
MKQDIAAIKALLDDRVEKYNQPAFIPNDPVSIPHRFTKKQDIEISGFFASILAWGQRKTIINNCLKLMDLMDNAPHDFILHHQEQDLPRFLGFKHRTFNDTDLLYFIHFFNWYYSRYESLEVAFTGEHNKIETQKERLMHFHDLVFSLEDAPHRTKKHISTPARKSACKRINMYLRWMVRKDNNGVDFGIWNTMKPADLVCPCDVHVERVARRLGLITRKGMNWQTAEELTDHLRAFDPLDPVKYDYALFGLGIEEKF